MKKYLLIVCSLAFIPSLNFAKATQEVINTKKGLTFTITLDANPSTGNSWHLAEQPDSSIVRLEQSHYTPGANPHGVIGKGGKQTWQFKALKEGDITLHFAYRKPWEAHLNPAETKDVKVSIKK